MQLRITGPRHDALVTALSIAYQDQEEYIRHGDAARDYGEEWPEAATRKARTFHILCGIARSIGEDTLGSNFDQLGLDVIANGEAYRAQVARRQQRCQAPAYHRGPDTPAAFQEPAE